MKFLDQYHNSTTQGKITISAKQGSDFAKNIAGDFNPIHDSLSKRFCVPGDLLFALALKEYGLHKNMAFEFLDLVSADTEFSYPQLDSDEADLKVLNSKGKAVLAVQYNGGGSSEALKTEKLLKNYVAFSGQNFPVILVSLMKQHGVMVNPKRTLVIYKSMSFALHDLSFNDSEIELENSELSVNGKRGNAVLSFSIKSNGQAIGTGRKTLVLSGLRDYDELAVEELSEEYLARKNAWSGSSEKPVVKSLYSQYQDFSLAPRLFLSTGNQL